MFHTTTKGSKKGRERMCGKIHTHMREKERKKEEARKRDYIRMCGSHVKQMKKANKHR